MRNADYELTRHNRRNISNVNHTRYLTVCDVIGDVIAAATGEWLLRILQIRLCAAISAWQVSNQMFN